MMIPNDFHMFRASLRQGHVRRCQGDFVSTLGWIRGAIGFIMLYLMSQQFWASIFRYIDMEVSQNGDSPNGWFYSGKSYKYGWFRGTPNFKKSPYTDIRYTIKTCRLHQLATQFRHSSPETGGIQLTGHRNRIPTIPSAPFI